MRNGGIRQQAFEVMLKHGAVTAYQQRDGARTAHQPEPGIGITQHRPHAGQQKHTRLDHGGGVQICRHGRGCCHRIRQPELKRKLRTLGQRTQQDKHQCHQIELAIAHLLASSQHIIQVITAHDMTEHQHAHQHGQPTSTRHRQSHARTAAGIFAVVPVANQEEGEKTGQLPEKHQLNDVAREHHARHSPHEGQKKREKTRHRVSGRHVIARIQHDQRPNAKDQHGEQPGKAIHTNHKIQTQRWKPGNLLTQHAPIGHFREQHPHLNGTDQSNNTR